MRVLTLSQRPILITGGTGQVGSALTKALAGTGEIHAPSRSQLDLADHTSIRAAVRFLRPRWIVNPAAYTAVDKAESEPELARAVNADAPRILGEEARRIGAAVIHFSTDYVFDGAKPTPYLESDPTNPLSVYGHTKLAGEQALADSEAPHLILRTSWVYAATGKNFLLTILKLALTRPELKIVSDQHGAPTWSHDLGRLTAHLIAHAEAESSARGLHLASVIRSGIYHATSAGETTWHGFASEFLRLKQLADPASTLAHLIPILTSEYPTPARRPLNSRLDCEKLYRAFGFRLPHWRDSLAHVMAEVRGMDQR
jgi:dTDP-4-dehydrorhamnose reductase